jgi:hypothetical protein
MTGFFIGVLLAYGVIYVWQEFSFRKQERELRETRERLNQKWK